MICHDQDIDRRILQEAAVLHENGWEGILIALSHTAQDSFDVIDGLTVHRIGLSHIIQDCPVYLRWIRGNFLANALPFSRLFRMINQILFRIGRLVKYHRISGNPIPFDRAFLGAAHHYRSDLVQAHDLPALAAAVTLGEEWNVPVAYDAHEFYPEQAVFSRRQKYFMFRIEGEHIKKCAAVFAVNQSIAKAMAEKYGIPEPCELTNAINPPAGVNPVGDLLRTYFGLPSGTPVALLQGGLAKRRNLELLVRAMSFVEHPSVVLVIMGGGPFRAELGDLAKRTKGGGRILFKDAVPQIELLSWTRTATFGVIPYPAVDLNTRFCTPNKLFEYIQAGLPILANDLPELRRFVRDTGFGRVVAMTDPRSVAAAIDDFLADPGSITDMREKIRNDKAMFSWDVQGARYFEVIDKLVAKNPPVGRN